MIKAKTEGFRVLPSYYEAIRELPKMDRLALYDAIFDYGFGYEVDDVPAKLAGYFALIKPTLDKSVQFETKQTTNGRKGGRPKNPKSEVGFDENENPNSEEEKPNTENEKNLAVAVDSAVAVAVDNNSAEPEVGFAPPAITLPLNDGTGFDIFDDQIAEWEGLYPAVDVRQELRNMRGWCQGNPTKLKTQKGIGRFIHSWLSKEQDRGGHGKGEKKSSGMVFVDMAREVMQNEQS